MDMQEAKRCAVALRINNEHTGNLARIHKGDRLFGKRIRRNGLGRFCHDFAGAVIKKAVHMAAQIAVRDNPGKSAGRVCDSDYAKPFWLISRSASAIEVCCATSGKASPLCIRSLTREAVRRVCRRDEIRGNVPV